MEKIQNGKYVELGYDLYEVAADGSQKLVHQTDIEDPEKFVYGVTEGMIEPLERAVEGLEVGGTFDIIVKCDDAFGPHDPDQVAELDRDIFVVDGNCVYSNSTSMNQIIARKNIIYNLSVDEPIMFKTTDGSINIGFDKWTKDVGKDTGSVVLNPKFARIENFDFTLSDNSPAIAFGFKPITGFTASGK